MPDVFQILADPTRRRIVDALRDGERSVNELVQVVDIGQPGVSRQLQILEDAGLVRTHKTGRVRRCELEPERIDAAAQWIEQLRRRWDRRLDRIEKYARQQEKR